MKRRHFTQLVFGGLSVLLVLGGCSGASKKLDSGATAFIEKSEASTEIMPKRPDGDPEWVDIGEVGAAWGVVERIHFDYDKSKLKKEWVEGLDNNARFMKDNPQYIMRVEGHCDERGTNEYNLALGERRALTAKEYLVSKGVASDRVHTISYGEDRPISFCHDESCWWQNRRAQFLVAKRQ